MDKTTVGLFTEMFTKVLTDVLKDHLKNNVIYSEQEYITAKEAMKRYGLCASTLRNYHQQECITICRMVPEKRSRLFVSVIEIERQLRNNPLPRRLSA